MAVLPIVRLGHPSLRLKSKPVTKQELALPNVQKFFDDLVDTCIAANGAGIAAPQVGINRQVIIVNIHSGNPRYPGRETHPQTIAINPVVRNPSKELAEDWEGDLSANIRALVPRPNACEIHYWDREGNEVKLKLTGFPARVFHHEIDHLNGVFLTDRVKKVESLCETEQWDNYWTDRKTLPEPSYNPYEFPKEF